MAFGGGGGVEGRLVPQSHQKNKKQPVVTEPGDGALLVIACTFRQFVGTRMNECLGWIMSGSRRGTGLASFRQTNHPTGSACMGEVGT